MSDKKTILSGIQPSGKLCIANQLGAINNWVDLQDDYNSIFLIVDLHSLTVEQVPSELRQRCLSFVAQYIACGIDPEKSVIAIQSHIHEHAELSWVLSTLASLGELNRMTQFKDKSKKHAKNINAGLFTYPVLMASDILIYNADLVPVGADQKQHLELSRDIAQKFNNDFNTKDFFPLPEPLIQKNISRVMSLRDGSKKMSKSEESDYSRINLKDSADEIAKKIKKAKTDTNPITENIKDYQNRPEAYNLLSIYSDISDQKIETTINEFVGKDFSSLKEKLSEKLIETISPIGKNITKLMKDKKHLEDVLKKGKEKASIIAEENLKKIREIVGFV